MAISRISDILIAATLIINAIALISSKVSPLGGDLPGATAAAASALGGGPLSEKPVPDTEPAGFRAVLQRLSLLVRGVRKGSCFIAIWNAIFLLLILLVFS